MSQENVELVQAIYDRVLAQGSLSDPVTLLAAVEELFDPDVEVDQMADVIGTAGTFRGYEGLQNAAREQLAVFEEMYFIAEEHFEAGANVVTDARVRAKGRGSGVEVDMRVGHVWLLRAGRVVRWVVYKAPAEALEAVGLPAR